MSNDQNNKGDKQGGNRGRMSKLTSDKSYTISELKTLKPVPSPHTVNTKTIQDGNSLTLANTSGKDVHFAWMKGVYQKGVELNVSPQGECILRNGEVFYERAYGCFNFVVNYTEFGHSQSFNRESATYEIKDYAAFNIKIIDGELSVHGTEFDSQQKGIAYFFIDVNAPELKDWSIVVSFNEEPLKCLKPEVPGQIFVDDEDNTMKPTASYRMEDEYSVYIIQQSDIQRNQLSKQKKKFEVSIGPKFMVPGDICLACESERSTGATTLVVTGIEDVTDPSSKQVPIGGGSLGSN